MIRFRFTLDQRQDIGKEAVCYVRTALRDPFCRKFLFLVADPSHRLQAAGKLVGGIGGPLEGCHFSCFPGKGGADSEGACHGRLLDIRPGGQHPAASLAYIELNGADLDVEPVTDEGFQDFSAAGEHFVSKGIQLCGVGIFADKGSSGVGNALGNADDHIGCFFKGTLQILVKGLQLKGSLGEVDEDRVVSLIFSCQL